MAMRFGQWICSLVRISNLSGVPTSLRGRSYFSEALSRISEDSLDSPFKSKAFAFAVAPATLGIWATWIYHYDVLHLRTLCVKWEAEKKALELLGRLDSEKFKSEDAYLEMLERELNVLKEKLSQRRTHCFDLMIHKREMDVLKEKIEASLAKENNPPQAVRVHQGG